MRPFLTRTMLFLAPLLMGALIIESLIQKIPNEYAYKKEYLDKHSDDIEVLILGSSHMYYGANPEYIKLNSFNASHIAQTLDYDYAIFKKYETRWRKLKAVVIPVDYFSLFNTLETGTESWRVKNYNIYYDLNSKLELVRNAEILSHEFRKSVSRIYRAYIKKERQVSWSPLGWGNSYHSHIKKDLTAAGRRAANLHRKHDDLSFHTNVKRLEAIIELAKSKNIAIIIITSPAYKSYVENLDDDQLNSTIMTVRKLAQSTGVAYHNLLVDKTFQENDFYDADHLNRNGARKLSVKLDSLIQIAITSKGSPNPNNQSVNAESVVSSPVP